MKRKRGSKKQKQLLVDLTEYESFIVSSAQEPFRFSLPCQPAATLEEAETLANSLRFSSSLAPDTGTVNVDACPTKCSDVSRLNSAYLETNKLGDGTESRFIISGAQSKYVYANECDHDDANGCDVPRCFNGILWNRESDDDGSKCELTHKKRRVELSEYLSTLAASGNNQKQIYASAEAIRSEQGKMYTMEYGKINFLTGFHHEASCDYSGFGNCTNGHVHECGYGCHEHQCGNIRPLRNSVENQEMILGKHDNVGSCNKELHNNKSPENDYSLASSLNRYNNDGCRSFGVVIKGIGERETDRADNEEYIVNSVLAPCDDNLHDTKSCNYHDSFSRLLEAKLKIMEIRLKYGADVWSLASQIINPYEVLPSFSIPVLNRAFFKMWEVIQIYPNIVEPATGQSRFLSAHLCEGPGGFIEALLMHRMQKSKSSILGCVHAVEAYNNSVTNHLSENRKMSPMEDAWFAITLATSYNKQASLKMQTEKLKGFCQTFAEGHIHYGADGSGNIMNPDNISAFVGYVLEKTEGEKMLLITGDGAFDISDDFSLQEESHAQLIFCELLIALKLQCQGGALVMKLFDCFTYSTKTILFIISSLYAEVEIVKLRTSRICNSERYVVARGFHGLPFVLEQKLMSISVAWYKSSIKGYMGSISHSETPSSKFLNCLTRGNAAITNDQVTSILQAVDVAEQLGDKLLTKTEDQCKAIISVLRRKLKTLSKQKENALSLCRELNIPLSNTH